MAVNFVHTTQVLTSFDIFIFTCPDGNVIISHYWKGKQDQYHHGTVEIFKFGTFNIICSLREKFGSINLGCLAAKTKHFRIA